MVRKTSYRFTLLGGWFSSFLFVGGFIRQMFSWSLCGQQLKKCEVEEFYQQVPTTTNVPGLNQDLKKSFI
jgi:hypothetical protein